MLKRGWKSRWIAALRSGKYKQAQSVLMKRSDTGKIKGYCCLGVLARVEGARFDQSGRPHVGGVSVKQINNDELLDEAWSGLSYNIQDTLARMNDDGMSFKKIATWIKKNVKAK